MDTLRDEDKGYFELKLVEKLTVLEFLRDKVLESDAFRFVACTKFVLQKPLTETFFDFLFNLVRF